MSASDHMQPEQLRMFMSPREVLGEYKVNSLERASVCHHGKEGLWKENDTQYWSRKLDESKAPLGNTKEPEPLYSSIRKRGVESPVHLVTGQGDEWADPKTIGNGAHRIIAQNQHDPDRLMPVVHHGTLPEAVHTGKLQEVDREISQRKATLRPVDRNFLKTVFG